MKKIGFLTLLLSAALACASCAKDYLLEEAERAKNSVPIWMSTRVTVMGTRGTRTGDNFVTTDNYEDKVVSLRLIISESGSGKIVKNIFYNNPTDLEKALIQNGSQWTKPFKIVPGQYDFWFIANEGSNWYSPTNDNRNNYPALSAKGNNIFGQLTEGQNIARIFDGKVLTGADAQLTPLTRLDIAPYKAGSLRDVAWQPSAERPMPMSAVYRNVTVARTDAQGRGAQEDNPQHFIGNGHDVVQLVRCMAKVTLVVKKAAHVTSAGKIDRLEWPYLGQFTIVVGNRPRYWSFFNTPLFDMNHTPTGGFSFYNNIFSPDTTRHLALRLKPANSFAFQNNGQSNLLSPSGGNDDMRDYTFSFYLPEQVIEKKLYDGEPTGPIADDEPWWDRVFISFSPTDKRFYTTERNSDLFNETVGSETARKRFWPFSSVSDWKSALEETTYFRLGHREWPEQADGTGNPLLPNPDRYSKFSLLRNRHYTYTVRERDRLQVDVRIAPWDEVPASGETVMLDETQLKIDDPTFSNSNKKTTIRLQNNFANHKWTYAVISLLDNDEVAQNSYRGTSAYFENFGTLDNAGPPVGEDRQKATVLVYGQNAGVRNPAHHAALGYVDVTLNWSAAQGKNVPAAGKKLIKLVFYDAENVAKTLYITPKGSDWKNTYHAVEGNTDF